MYTIQKKLMLIMIAILSTLTTLVVAQDAAALLKTINTDLRQTERDMFSGNNEKAIASLENIKITIETIKKDDPNNPTLKTVENKYNKLVKDLERRTGKQLGGGTSTSTSDASTLPAVKQTVAKPADNAVTTNKETVTSPNSSASQKLPYAARQPLSSAKSALQSLQGNLKNLNDPGYPGNKDQLVGNMERKIAEARNDLEKARALAAEKGVTSHPDFDAAETQLAEAENNLSGAKSGHEKNKAAAAASSKEVDADVAEIKALYDKSEDVLSRATGTEIYYNQPEQLEEVLTKIENFEKTDLPNIKPKLDKFAAKYGSAREEIDKKTTAMGYSNHYYNASFAYTELQQGIENINKTRQVMAESIVRRTSEEIDHIGKGAEFSMLERYKKVRDWVKMAARFQADNPKVKELQGSMDQRINAGMQEFHARVDKRSWPGHASNAPSNATELAKVSLTWFKNSPDWGKRSDNNRQPLAVVVTGPWSVQERNLLGNPIMYGLPIKLAVRVNDDKELNVVRVYDLTMRTVESANAKMEPPFDHVTVGSSYFIRPDKVK